jgi:HlyD family secretion protein
MLKKIGGAIKKQKAILIVVLLLAGGALVTAALWGKGAAASDYITAKAEMGSVEVNVSATGTVQAVTTVQVGSQVSGTVSWLGADFNSEVKQGQVIARLDPAVLQTQVENAKANVMNAEAAVRAAETDILNQKANLAASKANQEVLRVQRDDAIALVKRYQELTSVLSGRELEGAQAQASAAAARHEQATAQIAQVQAANESAKARVEQSKASLAQARAQLEQASVNLSHAVISSPIDGVVVSRNVDVGQTVAASLSAPTLFTIANDLTKMQVLASIDEADVGQIKQGIVAEFQVDAYTNETFQGSISQLRLNAQTLQNVVTYSAVIDVANPNMKLRPGMTANITIPVARKENVLTVPNAALRFKPELTEAQQQELRAKMEARKQERQNSQGGEGGAPQGTPQSGEGRRERRGGPNQEGGQNRSSEGEGQRRPPQQIWILVDGKNIEPRFLRTGLTNGRVTEVVGGDIREGDVIVTGQNDPSGGNRPTQGAPFGRPGGFPGGGRGPR